ncbi:hypothetical protein ES708_24332 [subsurface metagenome]
MVKVPSFSAKLTPGRITSASSAVSERKISCTTRNSSLFSASSAWVISGSLSSGFSPIRYIAFILPL